MSKQLKKKHLNIFWIAILILLNGIAALALTGAFVNHFVPPEGATRLAFLGLAFPYLLLINILFVLFWLFVKYSLCLISLIPMLLNINNIDRNYQLKGNSIPLRCINCVKIMTFNVKLLGFYDVDRNGRRQEMINFLRKEKPDILCLQEYFVSQNAQLYFPTTESILDALELENNHRYYYQYFPVNHKNQYFFGMAIFSRYPIISTGVVQTPDSYANGVIYADIRYKTDTLRVYCAHLASMHLDKQDYAVGKQVMETQFSDPKMNRNLKIMMEKLSKTFHKRRYQADILQAHIDTCSLPVIVCGDFNDTPISYVYYQIAKNLKDSFRESGIGKGETYHNDAFPLYRIDYILHDRRYHDYNHTVHTDITGSDHYPVSTVISLQK